MNKDTLKTLILEGNSTYQISKIVGKVPNTITYWIDKLELDNLYKEVSLYRKYSNKIQGISREELEPIVRNSNSLTECLNKLGIKAIGRNYLSLDKRVKFLKIKHDFRPREIRIKKLKDFNEKRCTPLEDVLIENSDYSRKSLKKRLYATGLKEKECELCGQREEWKGGKMSLILDHINGIFNDNRIENLRIICPNCNATLPTHCGRNVKDSLVV